MYYLQDCNNYKITIISIFKNILSKNYIMLLIIFANYKGLTIIDELGSGIGRSCAPDLPLVTGINTLIPPSSVCSLLAGIYTLSGELIIILLVICWILLLALLVKLIDSKAMQLIRTIYKIYL